MLWFKYIIAKILLFIIKKLQKLFRIFAYFLDFFYQKTIKKVLDAFFFYIILPLYKVYIYFKNLFASWWKNLDDWIFYPFTSKYTIYIFIVLISFNIAVANLYAKDLQGDLTPIEGQNGILLSLITPSDSSLIEEKANYKHFDYSFTWDDLDDDYLDTSNLETDLAVNYMEEIADATFAKPSILKTQKNIKLRDKIETYVVQSGDTLSTIAEKFGLKLSTLLDANNLTLRSNIKPGQKLTILPVDGFIYKVKSGDSINKLASKFKAQAKQIIAYNHLEDTTLSKGQELIIPFGVKPKPQVTKPSYTYVAKKNNNTYRENNSHNYYTEYHPGKAALPSNTKLQWPCSEHIITQYYHYGHPGLDISGPARLNADLYAAEDGVVIRARTGWNGGYGTYVIIDHGNGIQTLYGHASKLFVKEGDHVKRGQVIAKMGSTGRSTGPHIHFEVRVNGKRMNPLNYIR